MIPRSVRPTASNRREGCLNHLLLVDNHWVNPFDSSPRILHQYLVLVEEMHFGRAADRLQISQPSLSQAISRLERLVGFTLLNRTSRTVQLTPAGASFALDVQRIREAQNAAIMRGQRIAGGEEGELQLGTTGSLAYAFISGFIRRCHEELPNLRLRLHDCPSMELAERVRDGRVDIALAAGPLPDSTHLSVQFLAYERIVAVLPADHRLADKPDIELAELAGEDFALYSDAGHRGLLALVLSACQSVGFIPHEVATADTIAGLVGHVASGKCVSFAPDRMRLFTPLGVVFKPIAPKLSAGDEPDPAEILKTQIVSVVLAGHNDPLIDKVLRLLHDPGALDVVPLR